MTPPANTAHRVVLVGGPLDGKTMSVPALVPEIKYHDKVRNLEALTDAGVNMSQSDFGCSGRVHLYERHGDENGMPRYLYRGVTKSG